MKLVEITGKIDGIIWGTPFLIVLLGVGILYTVALRLPQIRLIKDQLKNLLGGGSSDEGISSFEAFAISLGGRVGTGNIAGVATAIGFGGPGSVFWMWIIAIVGAALTLGESTLGQVFKEKVGNEYAGGPAFYLDKGTGFPLLGAIYAVLIVFACAVTGPTVQAYNISSTINQAFGIPVVVIGIVVAALFVLCVFGGAKRIGKFSGIVVPFMALAYILVALFILITHAGMIPSMFAMIFKCAFGKEAIFGGMLGTTIIMGVKRGMFSSDAGTGQGAHASSNAEVSHPVKQGLAQSFSVYVDTLFVCTATALMILCTNCYNVTSPDGTVLVENLKGMTAGTGFVQSAINTLGGNIGNIFIAVAMFFFAFTTLLNFGVCIQNNINYVLRNAKASTRKAILVGGNVVCTVIIFVGSIQSAESAWNLADIGVGLFGWVNIIGMAFLLPLVLKLLKDYEDQKKLGIDPVFDPDRCGIKNADLWKDIVRDKYSDLMEKRIEAEKGANN
ncbi:MAG: alanine:cation symporter family protein [Eubacterium sp.]|nr:alanine:cation symporter family protein [Eubacterium sp.]